MSNDEAIKEIAQLAVRTAESVAVLMERVQGNDDHRGPQGGEIQLPTVAQRVKELRSEANRLSESLGLPQSNPSDSSLGGSK
jgi:hypothetical protein